MEEKRCENCRYFYTYFLKRLGRAHKIVGSGDCTLIARVGLDRSHFLKLWQERGHCAFWQSRAEEENTNPPED